MTNRTTTAGPADTSWREVTRLGGDRRDLASVAAAAALSGSMLAVADRLAGAAPLQLVAFIPVLLRIRRSSAWTEPLVAGVVLAVVRWCLFAPALSTLPAVAWVGVPVYVALTQVSVTLAWFALRGVAEPGRSLLVAAACAAIELVDAHLPMWGTALSLACAWTNYRWAIRFIAVVGTAAVAFVVIAAQSLFIAWASTRRFAPLVALAALVGSAAAIDAIEATPAQATLRVAAIASSDSSGPPDFDVLVADAAARGARLVVLPEAAFIAAAGERADLLRRLGELARRNRVHLAVGYLDRTDDENRLALFAPDGSLAGQYTKTHLVPLAEKTRAGRGELVIVDVDGVPVGAMICQDDNFSDLTRRYARAGARILVSPTYEMSGAMGPLHLRNALLRPIEGAVAYVRAATNGTSAIVSSDGTIRVSSDHDRGGPAVIVSDVAFPATAMPRAAPPP